MGHTIENPTTYVAERLTQGASVKTIATALAEDGYNHVAISTAFRSNEYIVVEQQWPVWHLNIKHVTPSPTSSLPSSQFSGMVPITH